MLHGIKNDCCFKLFSFKLNKTTEKIKKFLFDNIERYFRYFKTFILDLLYPNKYIVYLRIYIYSYA